jgi:hypothetical protein
VKWTKIDLIKSEKARLIPAGRDDAVVETLARLRSRSCIIDGTPRQKCDGMCGLLSASITEQPPRLRLSNAAYRPFLDRPVC